MWVGGARGGSEVLGSIMTLQQNISSGINAEHSFSFNLSCSCANVIAKLMPAEVNALH